MCCVVTYDWSDWSSLVESCHSMEVVHCVDVSEQVFKCLGI